MIRLVLVAHRASMATRVRLDVVQVSAYIGCPLIEGFVIRDP